MPSASGKTLMWFEAQKNPAEAAAARGRIAGFKGSGKGEPLLLSVGVGQIDFTPIQCARRAGEAW